MMKGHELRARHKEMRPLVEERLADFKRAGKKGGRALFEELSFCLFTPQSKARFCDLAVRELLKSGLLFKGDEKQIAAVLSKRTRFHNNKARYVLAARERFSPDGFAPLARLTFHGSEKEAREKLVRDVLGLGMKEASHYLRNVGRGRTIAILDRHILRNLVSCGAIPSLPKSLTRRKYLEIEGSMERFCKKSRVPLSHLDLVFWAEETGEIFK